MHLLQHKLYARKTELALEANCYLVCHWVTRPWRRTLTNGSDVTQQSTSPNSPCRSVGSHSGHIQLKQRQSESLHQRQSQQRGSRQRPTVRGLGQLRRLWEIQRRCENVGRLRWDLHVHAWAVSVWSADTLRGLQLWHSESEWVLKGAVRVRILGLVFVFLVS